MQTGSCIRLDLVPSKSSRLLAWPFECLGRSVISVFLVIWLVGGSFLATACLLAACRFERIYTRFDSTFNSNGSETHQRVQSRVSGHAEREEAITFENRPYVVQQKFAWKPYQPAKRLDVDAIEELLEQKLKELQRLKDEEEQHREEEARRAREAKEMLKPWKPARKPQFHMEKLPWNEEVNRRRRIAAGFLERQEHPNLAEVCRQTGFSFGLVKRVASDLAFNKQVSVFVYPNQKTAEQLQQLEQSIEAVNGSFSTITDLKRKNKGFSRQYIRKRLKETGHHWLKVRMTEKHPRKAAYTDLEVLATVRHLSQCLVNPQVETFYLDEVHFPLFQTSDHHWSQADYRGHNEFYNRRFANEDKLTVIAMCSLQRFVAIQVYQKEVRGEDFLFFLQEAMRLVPTGSKISVLADNATWHKAAIVMKTPASKAMEFNAPGLFQANLIENAFSFVRSEFRKRPTVTQLPRRDSTPAQHLL